MTPLASPGSTAVAESVPPGKASISPGREAWQLFLWLTFSMVRRGTADRLLGAWWWVIDPLVLIGVYAIVFGEWMGLRHGPEGGAYALFVASALVTWRCFSLATASGANAFLRNTSLLTSVPISREVVLLSEQAAALLRSLAGLPVLILFMLVYETPFTWNLALVPLAMATLVLLSAGVAYVLCPLTTLLPDVTDAYAAWLRLAWFLSPGVYSLARVPEDFRPWYVALNPFVGIFEGVRRPILEGLPPLWDALGWSALWAVTLCFVGRTLFRRWSHDVIRML